MHFYLPLILIFSLINKILCDVEISSPTDGSSFAVSGSEVTIKLKWTDDDNTPDIKNAKTMTLVLCTGNNTNIESVETIDTFTSSDDITSGEYSAVIDADIAGSGYFYVQFYTVFSNGYTIHYSDRFKLTGMTGASVKEASGSGDPPPSEYSITVAASDISKSFTVPYTLQTGHTRYAPMQMQPGTTITATTWSRRFASSSVTYYTSASPSPNVYSTITPGWSYTASSLVNYASPAPFPSAVGWYSAEQRLVSASIDSSLKKIKKRRWDD